MEKNVERQSIAIKKILMPIDRSEYREKIIAYALALAKAWGAELTAINVIDPGRGVPGGRLKKRNRREKKKQNERLKR